MILELKHGKVSKGARHLQATLKVKNLHEITEAEELVTALW